MLKKIYQELIAIRKELQSIREKMESLPEEKMKDYINRLLVEDYLQSMEKRTIDGEKVSASVQKAIHDTVSKSAASLRNYEQK